MKIATCHLKNVRTQIYNFNSHDLIQNSWILLVLLNMTSLSSEHGKSGVELLSIKVHIFFENTPLMEFWKDILETRALKLSNWIYPIAFD